MSLDELNRSYRRTMREYVQFTINYRESCFSALLRLDEICETLSWIHSLRVNAIEKKGTPSIVSPIDWIAEIQQHVDVGIKLCLKIEALRTFDPNPRDPAYLGQFDEVCDLAAELSHGHSPWYIRSVLHLAKCVLTDKLHAEC